MFPGSLQLGKWRIRGDVAGEFYLERFDDDGAQQTGEWYPVCLWGFNTQNNSAGMNVSNLGVAFNLSAGNITATGTTALQGLSATSLTVGGVNVLGELGGKQAQLTQEGFGTELLYDSNRLKRLQFGSGLVGGTDLQPDGTQTVSIAASPNLSVSSLSVSGTTSLQAVSATSLASATIQTDTLTPIADAVTCDGNLTCNGRLAVAGVQVANGSVVIPDMLTVDGVNVGDALAASEPAFTAVAPLEKAFNIQTGQLELRVDTAGLGGNPFFCAGVVNGQNLAILVSQGQVSFTVSRVTNYPAGVYKVTFASSHPRGNNYVILVHSRSSNSYLTPPLVEAPTPQTAGYFHVTLRNTAATSILDEQFHFSVLA
jgi:hypothetical protein